MGKSGADTAITQTPLGGLLRQWRNTRGKSQLDVSLDTGVSQRHISFIESGRSVPGRQVLMEIAEVLDIPLRERNVLLLAAGYAPMYSDSAWNALEMRGIGKALERMLRQHDPYPAVVLDAHWNVLMANASAPRFFNTFIDMAARQGRRNLLHLMFDPAGMRPFIADWEGTAKALLRRVHREAVGRVLDEEGRRLLATLHAYPDVQSGWRSAEADEGAGAALPMIPLGFIKDGRVLNYFSMVSTVGTPQTVAAQELRVECLFPADDATEAAHQALMDGGAVAAEDAAAPAASHVS